MGKALNLGTTCRFPERRTGGIPEKSKPAADWPTPSRGRRQGEEKGANLTPEMASPTKLQTSFQFLAKDFLRFWMVDIHWEGHC